MSIVDDLNNLEIENMGSWPFPIKVGSIILLFTIILGLGWYLDWKHQWEMLEKAKKDEQDKLSQLDIKQRKAANLEPLRQQMIEMEQSFGDMLRQLPDKTEVAGLLVDISQTGLGAGLEFELFKPAPEKPTEFYAELPIQIQVVGQYHEFGDFVSGVASLPRIVTMHDVEIKVQNQSESSDLTMISTAKTYRALDDDDDDEVLAQ